MEEATHWYGKGLEELSPTSAYISLPSCFYPVVPCTSASTATSLSQLHTPHTRCASSVKSLATINLAYFSCFLSGIKIMGRTSNERSKIYMIHKVQMPMSSSYTEFREYVMMVKVLVIWSVRVIPSKLNAN